MRNRLYIAKGLIKDMAIYESKMAGARFTRHILAHKVPYILKNGLSAEIAYSLRHIPGYIWERASCNRNTAIMSTVMSTLVDRRKI